MSIPVSQSILPSFSCSGIHTSILYVCTAGSLNTNCPLGFQSLLSHKFFLTCVPLGTTPLAFEEGNGTPLQYSCLENPMDGGAWWAAAMGLVRVRHDWVTSLSLFTFMHWRRKWQPTPMFLPGESQGQGSLVGWLWTQSQTRLNRLSSSSLLLLAPLTTSRYS